MTTDACPEATPEDTALLGEGSSIACSATSLATGADNQASDRVADRRDDLDLG
jgi:hypothetical protein